MLLKLKIWYVLKIAFLMGGPWLLHLVNKTPESRQPDLVVYLIIGLGFAISLTGLGHAKNAIHHGWYHPSGPITLAYQLMPLGMFVFLPSSYLLYLLSQQIDIQGHSLFFFHTCLVGSACVFLISYCLVFQVQDNSRVVKPDGQILNPGQRYFAWPMLVADYAILKHRLTMPPMDISIRTSDGLERTVNVIPWIQVHLDQLSDNRTEPLSLPKFVHQVMNRIRTTLQDFAKTRSLVEFMERQGGGISFEAEGIPITWPGDAKLTFVTEHCSCLDDNCLICRPERTTSWHA